MALTFPRWILITASACALVFAGIHSGQQRAAAESWVGAEDPAIDSLTALERALNGRTRLLAEQLRDLEIRDSVLAIVKPAPGLSIYHDPALPPVATAMIDSVTRDEWASLHPPASGVPVIVAVLLDTNSMFRGVRRLGRGLLGYSSFLPAQLGRSVCLAVVKVSNARWLSANLAPNGRRADMISPVELRVSERTLGTCAYVAAFGAPGPAIAQWVQDRGILALDSHWARMSNGYHPQQSRTDLGEMAFGSGGTFEPARGYLSRDAFACSAGEAAPCEDVVLKGSNNPAVGPFWPQSDYAAATALDDQSPDTRTLPLGPRETSYLSDMVHTIGRDQFATFWRSSKSPAEAFFDATQVTLGSWTHGWIESIYGLGHVGPSAPGAATLETMVLAFLAIAAAILIARRRQLG